MGRNDETRSTIARVSRMSKTLVTIALGLILSACNGEKTVTPSPVLTICLDIVQANAKTYRELGETVTVTQQGDRLILTTNRRIESYGVNADGSCGATEVKAPY